jgi:hypothetical protein
VPEEVKESSRDVKIGELLVAVDIVSSGDLQEAIQIAKRMNLPIGRVIVMSGVISEQNLAYALEAQSLIKDGLLDIDTAVAGLKNAFRKGSSLQEALADMRWAPKKDLSSNKLGELLMDSNMVTQAQLDNALQTSFDTGMPLGGTLVLQGVLSAQLLPAVLTAQEHIREGKITRAGAVENLKAALMFWAKADDSKTQNSYDPFDSSPRSVSSMATPSPAPSAIPATPNAPTAAMGLVEMMKMAGYCNDAEIQAAIERALASADIASKLFMATGLLTKTSFDNFVRCRSLMLKGSLKPEQAIYALSACRIRAITLDEIFIEMGVKT